MSEEEKKVIEEIKKSIAIQDRLNDEIRKSGTEPFICSKRIDIYRVVLNLIEKQDKELKEEKNISKKLAEALGENCCHQKPLFMGVIADEIYGCDKYNNCTDCFLDWARKEVENEN